jgi:hypothetical protein
MARIGTHSQRSHEKGCVAQINARHTDGSVQVSGPTNVVDVFNARSRIWTTAALSVARHSLAATSLPNDGLAIFAGGIGAMVV